MALMVRAIDNVGNTSAWVESETATVQTTVTKYYYLAGQRVAMRQGGALTYLYGDHLGSTSLITNASGALVAETRYLPYGQVYWQWGASQTDFGFTGQRMDGFGLMDYNARYYDPLLGRFISPDTIIPNAGNTQDWDRYAYVSNNPIVFSDPSGHCYNRDNDGKLTARCQTYWENYSKGISAVFASDAFLLAGNWKGADRDTSTGAFGKAAQDKYYEILDNSGKEKISTQELLTTVEFNEFGTLTGNDYLLAEEALGRQWYHWCGSDGICTGSQIWQFLGSLEGWFNKSVDRLINGMATVSGIATAGRINSTKAWQNGSQSDRPFAFGNLSMYPNSRNAIIMAGVGWGKEQNVVLQVDGANPFIVWTPEQRGYWTKEERSSP